MFPLASKNFPPDSEALRAALEESLGQVVRPARPMVTIEEKSYPELAAIRALARDVPASMLLDSATRQGARALGLDADYGTIAPGKRARLIGVTLPPGVDDVEEYLLSGIQPEQIEWLTAEL